MPPDKQRLGFVHSFLCFVLDSVRRVIDNVYYYHPIVATGRYINSIRNKPDPFGYHKSNSAKMPPVTRSQKRSVSRGRTPNRVTGRRISASAYNTPMSVSPRGRSMARSTSGTRSLSRWMGSNVRRRSTGVYVPSLTKSLARLRTSRNTLKKYSKRSKYIYDGVVRVLESGGTTEDGEVVYIGHACPLFQMKYCAWWSLIKKLLCKMGANSNVLTGSQNLVSLGFTAGDIFRLTYKPSPAAGVATLDFAVAAGSTVDNLISQYATNGTIDTNNVVYNQFQFIPLGTAGSFRTSYFVRLESSYLSFYVKNDLKLQNRSTTTTLDNEGDDVNNVPLYGKSYFGFGCGTKLKNGNSASGLVANPDFGVISNTSSNLGTGYNEPLEYQYFANVKQAGKIHIDAGQVKTSQITKSFRMTFGNFLNAIAPANGISPVAAGPTANIVLGQASARLNKISSYRFFAVEKMLDANTTASPTNVSVAFEHNSKIMCKFHEVREDSTQISFVKFRYNP